MKRTLKWVPGTRLRVAGLGSRWLLRDRVTDAKGMVCVVRMRGYRDDPMFREYALWVSRTQVRKYV